MTAFYTISRLSDHMETTPEGFLLCKDVPIARCGVQLYRDIEIPQLDADADGWIEVDREAAEVFHPDSMASFLGKPIVNDHPFEEVDPDNYSDLTIGTVHNVRRGSNVDHDLLVADLLFTTRRGIDLVRRGKRAISVGYNAYYSRTARGLGRQHKIRCNHVALVDEGRCGERCVIMDGVPLQDGQTFPIVLEQVSRWVDVDWDRTEDVGWQEEEHPRNEEGEFTAGARRAAKGGGIAAINKAHYKGGQFLPATTAPPGTFKWKGKYRKGAGRQAIEPGYFHQNNRTMMADPPSPLHRAIFEMIGMHVQPAGQRREYLNVPYAQREEAKARGARWDAFKKQWYLEHQGEQGKLELSPQTRTGMGEPVTREMTMAPGVGGVSSTRSHSFGELVDRYNAGERWVEIELPTEDRTVDIDFVESEHPRDPEGKFTEAASHGVAGLPEGKVPRELSRFNARPGVFTLTAKPRGGDRYSVEISAPAPAGIKTISGGSRRPSIQYDPKLAHEVTLNPEEPIIARQIAVLNEGLADELPLKRDPGLMYRGMTAEEFERFQAEGEVKSLGEYNFPGQENLTYWSGDPGQAESYANSFAPAQFKPTFAKPAYVMVAKRAAPEHITPVKGVGEDELGVNRPVGRGEVTEVWRGRVAVFNGGEQDLTDRRGDFAAGGGVSPSAQVVWERVALARTGDDWNEAEHPREPAGSGEGGQFTVSPGGAAAEAPGEAVEGAEAEGAAEPTPPAEAPPASPEAQEEGKKVTLVGAPRPVAKAKQPGKARLPYYTFMSPNIGEGLSFAGAAAELHTKRQLVFNEVSAAIDSRLGLKAEKADVIGAWTDGAENSLMVTYPPSANMARVKAAAIVKGAMADQKAVLFFQPKPGGPDHMIDFSLKGELSEIHEKLLAAGIDQHTLQPVEGGATVHVFAKEEWEGAKVTAAVEALALAEGVTPAFNPGHGGFVGTNKQDGSDEEQRADALREYHKAYEALVDTGALDRQVARRLWKDSYDHWRAATGAAQGVGLRGSQGDPNLISSRRPTGVGALESDHYRRADMKAMEEDPRVFGANMRLLEHGDWYPQLRPEETRGRTPEQIRDAAIAMAVDNLKWLYNHAPEELRQQAHMWYEGAHAMAEDMAGRYGLPVQSTAAVIAALSPQNLWDLNVHQAEQALDIYHHQQDFKWTEGKASMAETARRIYTTATNKALLRQIEGKRLSELTTPMQKAAWIRAYDETYGPKDFNRLSPDGRVLGKYQNIGGGNTKIAWKTVGAIANAVRAIESGGDRAVLSKAMGDKHKVRSFYNNILDPHSKNDDVTMDTHAVGAALFAPETGKNASVYHSLNTGPDQKDQAKYFPNGDWENSKGSDVTGVQGTYPLWADAYRQAAHDLGIEPRVLQSATWEAKRRLFDVRITAAQKRRIKAQWQAFHEGRQDREYTRGQISDIMGGMENKPEAGVALAQPEMKRAA